MEVDIFPVTITVAASAFLRAAGCRLPLTGHAAAPPAAARAPEICHRVEPSLSAARSGPTP
jgi:hypothetical protein